MNEKQPSTSEIVASLEEQLYPIIKAELEVDYHAKIEGYKVRIAEVEKQRNLFGQILAKATKKHQNIFAGDEDAVREVERIFKLGTDFDIILKAKASHPMLEGIWDNFVMSLRLCGEDQKPQVN
jgi:hypothetical protein